MDDNKNECIYICAHSCEEKSLKAATILSCIFILYYDILCIGNIPKIHHEPTQ